MKSVIIVGGSKGIGNAILNTLVESHKIKNISRTEPQQKHSNLSHYPCDILNDELPDIESADALIYCPGSINLKPFNRLSLDEFKNDFNINVLGAVKVIQKYMGILKNGYTPSIVVFSSVAAKMGMPFHASIGAAKAGVEGLVKSLAAEFAPNLRINAIAPTVTDTDLASKILRNEQMIENMKDRHPLKKFLNPKEVAEMAVFLISEKAASISGQVFQMDCGIVTLKT